MNNSKREVVRILSWGFLKLLAKKEQKEWVLEKLLLDKPGDPSMNGDTTILEGKNNERYS